MDLFNIMHVYEDYVRNSLGGSFGFGYPFWDDWRIYLTYTIEEISVETGKYGRSGRRIKNLFTDGKTSSLTGSLSWDTRDNRLFPSRGHHYILSMEWADNILGSENIFTRMNCISRWYIPLVWKFVFKVNSQFGYIFSDDNLGIPIFERFVAGGIGLTTNLRGYYLRSISPTMPSPNNGYDVYSRISPFKKGGNKELIFNFEIEFPIFEKVGIRGVLFFDAGNVYDEDENLFYLGEKTLPAHLRQDFNWDPHQELPLGLFLSAGFGFRWFSPIGPLRFEWGIPLTPRPSDQNMLFEFTIGNSF